MSHLESDVDPPLASSPLETSWGDACQVGGDWSGDADVHGCRRLERRWVLWHEFMKEHAHLDAWLRLAEQAATSSDVSSVTYAGARDALRTLERLRGEAGPRLVRLDGLTHRNRTLTRWFRGAMRARLLALARECGRRWDDVNAKLETVAARLKLFVSEWEGFETEREELALWLADLDVRLTGVHHLKGNTCEKLRRLQSFQQCVCENSGRVNALLRRGEGLIQRSEPGDAQQVERRLLELLRHCSHVHGAIARTHTRLLSMRLVFEDDCILATDSGCPSESLLEDDICPLDVPVLSNCPGDSSQSERPTLPSVSPPPPSPSCPTHEHLGLEWDPSVDIGRSVSCDDRDSSYFSVTDDVLKRWSFFSSNSCQSDISNDITDQEEDSDHTHPAVQEEEGEEPRLRAAQWATSTPEERNGFDGGRVRAWLGVQSPAPLERRTSCSRGAQMDELTAGGDSSCCEAAKPSSSHRSSASSSSWALLFLLLAAALTLLAWLSWLVQDSPCHRSNRMGRSFHVALRYVNGPPPT